MFAVQPNYKLYKSASQNTDEILDIMRESKTVRHPLNVVGERSVIMHTRDTTR